MRRHQLSNDALVYFRSTIQLETSPRIWIAISGNVTTQNPCAESTTCGARKFAIVALRGIATKADDNYGNHNVHKPIKALCGMQLAVVARLKSKPDDLQLAAMLLRHR